MAGNTDIIRAVYSAFAAGDIPSVLQALAPDVRWTEAEGFPHGGTYHGPDAVLHNVIMSLGTEWEGFSAEPETFVAEGDKVVTLGRYRGVYKSTGKQLSVPFAHVWTVEHDKVTRFQQHTDTAVVQSVLQ